MNVINYFITLYEILCFSLLVDCCNFVLFHQSCGSVWSADPGRKHNLQVNVSGFHRALNVAAPLFIGGVPGTVSLTPQAITVQGELGARLHGLHQQSTSEDIILCSSSDMYREMYPLLLSRFDWLCAWV